MLLNGATHMLFILAFAELSTDEIPPRGVMVKSGYIPVIGVQVKEMLKVPIAGDAKKEVYIIVGISMYQEVNGDFYPLKNNP